MASAVCYLQVRNVIHRDLKLENILLDDNDDLKISDFGWAVHSISDKRETICGTIDYLAPEIVAHEKYNNAVDVWCIGILMYEMIYGFPPFGSDTKEETMEKIKNKDLKFYNDVREISEETKDLMTKLLEFDADSRIKAANIFDHPLFKLYPYEKSASTYEDSETKQF